MIANQSPFWLRLNGSWVHLDGVKPGVDMTPNRATSDFISVDGVRWVQQAPKGPRDWSLSFEYATPDAVAALRVATDIATDVWLLDTTLSQENMLPASACFGPAGGTEVACGSLTLPAISLSAEQVTILPVRSGVTYYGQAWTTRTGSIGTIAYPGGSATLTGADGSAATSFTPNADGNAVITLTATTTWTVSGLMLCEAVQPTTFLPGNGMPCQVTVGDPSRMVNLAWPAKYALADYAVSVREVG